MDHLKFKVNTSVPLHCETPTETGTKKWKDFWNLPKNKGWNITEDGSHSQERPICSFDKVLQEWLFFEVLAQVFGHLDSFKPERFVRTDGDNSGYITTKHLPELLETWLDKEITSPGSARTSRLLRIQQVLETARFYVFEYCSFQGRRYDPVWNEVDEILPLSFMVLGETLTHAQAKVHNKIGFNIQGWSSRKFSSPGWGYSRFVLNQLEDSLWCRTAIRMVQAKARGNVVGLLHLHTLDGASGARGPYHRECTPTKCFEDKLRQKDGLPAKPKPYHYCIQGSPREEQPDCNDYETVDGSCLARIIEEGNIPLFRYENQKLQVLEMKPSFNIPYSIFSHVWVDGFGGPEDQNQLSKCALTLFSRLVDDVNRMRSGNVKVKGAFWIDTLAIPKGRLFHTQRQLAIRNMHNIYVHARYMIVLDKSLMGVAKGPGYSTPAMKITMSRWMTRMWTLQEAILSKHIYFAFKDQLYAMDHLEDLYFEEADSLHNCLPTASQMYYHGVLGEKRNKVHTQFLSDERWHPKAKFIASVWKVAQWRTTSHLHHETLSLATITNLSTELYAMPSRHDEQSQLYKDDCNGRMLHFVSQLLAISPCPVPPGMIFLPGPKLQEKGYRWAPRSWLSSHKTDPPDPLGVKNHEGARFIEHQGLEVLFPGFRLHSLVGGPFPLHHREDFYFPTDLSLREWYAVHIADEGENFPTTSVLRKSLQDHKAVSSMRRVGDRSSTEVPIDIAIIASRLPAVDLKEIGLLVLVKETHSGIQYVEILNRIWLTRERKQSEILDKRTKFERGSFDSICAAEQLPADQKWCVDGLISPANREAEQTEPKAPKRSYTDGLRELAASFIPA